MEAAAEVDELSILVAAVEAAGAQDAFEDTSVKVTAFMPTNEAFNDLIAELGLKNVNELLASPLLPNILRYHVVGDPHTSDYFVEGVELPSVEWVLVHGGAPKLRRHAAEGRRRQLPGLLLGAGLLVFVP